MELLIDRLSTLVEMGVSRDEVLRQLNQAKPDLKKGDVLANAERLVGTFTTDAERRRAKDFLKDIIPTTESYTTSAGPLGTTRDEVTVWDCPNKPIQFLGLRIFLFLTTIGIALYLIGIPRFIWFPPLFLSIPIGIIVSTINTVAINKWRARQELDKKIIQNAKSFETILEKVQCESNTKSTFQLLAEGKPFCAYCGKQRDKRESTESLEVRPIDMEESHFVNCPYRKKLAIKKQLEKHRRTEPVLVQDACDCLDGLSFEDCKQVIDELVSLGNEPAEIIRRVEALWALQFGRC